MASTADFRIKPHPGDTHQQQRPREGGADAYFSADVETDGPIPGPFSILSFAIVYAGTFDGKRFERPKSYDQTIYKELKPISNQFQEEALRVNGLDRRRLSLEGENPESAMTEACRWIIKNAGHCNPVLVAYPLSFDWSWLMACARASGASKCCVQNENMGSKVVTFEMSGVRPCLGLRAGFQSR